MTRLDELNAKIDTCELQNRGSQWFQIHYMFTREQLTIEVLNLEVILPTRVPEENFVDILNLIRASYHIEGGDAERALVCINCALAHV